MPGIVVVFIVIYPAADDIRIYILGELLDIGVRDVPVLLEICPVILLLAIGPALEHYVPAPAFIEHVVELGLEEQGIILAVPSAVLQEFI